MQNMLTRWSHGGIQHRGNGEHNGISFGSDATLPVIYPDGVDGEIIKAAGVEAQMKMQKPMACGRLLALALLASGNLGRQ